MNNPGLELRSHLMAQPGKTIAPNRFILEPVVPITAVVLGKDQKPETRHYHVKEVGYNAFFDADERSKPFWAVVEWPA